MSSEPHDVSPVAAQRKKRRRIRNFQATRGNHINVHNCESPLANDAGELEPVSSLEGAWQKFEMAADFYWLVEDSITFSTGWLQRCGWPVLVRGSGLTGYERIDFGEQYLKTVGEHDHFGFAIFPIILICQHFVLRGNHY